MRRGVRVWPPSAIQVVLGLLLGALLTEPASAARFNDQSPPLHTTGELTADKKDGGRRLPNVACDDLELRIGADVGERSCRAASISNADARARAEIVNAQDAGSIFVAEYVNAGMHTYILRSAPRDIAGEFGLQKAPGEPEARFQMHGFDVWRFEATLGMQCAAFAKHWSRVPRSSGYRHRIVGVYCTRRASDIADAGLDGVLASIEPRE